MKPRVVVVGVGVVAPNGIGRDAFASALRAGRSGIRSVPQMAELGLGCTVAGIPEGVEAAAEAAFAADEAMAMNSSIRHAALAAVEAWEDAGLSRPSSDDEVDWETGAVVGTGIGGMDTIAAGVPLIDGKKTRRLGSTYVEKVMGSGVSARISGLLALGNQVTTNSSACSTGTEALVVGMDRIRSGRARRMVCGGAEGASVHSWAGFDALRVLARGHNEAPAEASRPMSESADGFVPSCGAGLLVLESLDSALARGADIRAELLGGAVNCGGHRGGGSMTAPNPEGVVRCVRDALADAGVGPRAIDAINGHLTATSADAREVDSWARALEASPRELPPITSTKSMIGHALGAAGGIESVACVLMLQRGFVHASINCEDLHPALAPYAASVPHETMSMPGLRTMVKAGFGFGDVNACVVLRRWDGA